MKIRDLIDDLSKYDLDMEIMLAPDGSNFDMYKQRLSLTKIQIKIENGYPFPLYTRNIEYDKDCCKQYILLMEPSR